MASNACKSGYTILLMNTGPPGQCKDGKGSAKGKKSGDAGDEQAQAASQGKDGKGSAKGKKSGDAGDERAQAASQGKDGKGSAKGKKSGDAGDEQAQSASRGKDDKGSAKGKKSGDAHKRQMAFLRVVQDTKPTIIFLQEDNGNFELVILGCQPQDYSLVDEASDPGMIVDEKEFTSKCLTHAKAEELKKFVTNSKDTHFTLDMLDRIRVVKCTSKSKDVPKLVFLGISWHGPHMNKTKVPRSRYEEDEKVNILKGFIVVVNKIRKLYKGKDGFLPSVIIGGDFNLNIDRFPENDDLIKHEYTASVRKRGRQIDFFVTTRDFNDNVSDVKYHDIMSLKLKDQTEFKNIFDHDPVTAVLSVSTSSSAGVDNTMVEKLANLKIQN